LESREDGRGCPSSNHEIGTTTAIYPDPAPVISPAITLGAACIASLPYKLHAATRVRGAVISPAVIRGTGNGLPARTSGPITRSSWPVGIDAEIRATATIDPDSATVVAPAITLLTAGIAALPHHRYAAPCICRAVIPFSVIRRASDHLLCRCRSARHGNRCADAQSQHEKSSHSHLQSHPRRESYTAGQAPEQDSMNAM
jgi:hypothetical protein